MSKKWLGRGHAGTQRSKGFATGGNWCYINAALQALMHQPQLLNWLQTHNCQVRRGAHGSRTVNGCNASPPPYWGMPVSTKAPDCTACMMKELVNTYWANTPDTTITPNMRRIRRIALAGGVARWNANRSGIIQLDSNDFYQMILQRLEIASA